MKDKTSSYWEKHRSTIEEHAAHIRPLLSPSLIHLFAQVSPSENFVNTFSVTELCVGTSERTVALYFLVCQQCNIPTKPTTP